MGVERGVSSPTTSRQWPRIPSEVRETLCEVRQWEHVGLMVGLGHVTWACEWGSHPMMKLHSLRLQLPLAWMLSCCKRAGWLGTRDWEALPANSQKENGSSPRTSRTWILSPTWKSLERTPRFSSADSLTVLWGNSEQRTQWSCAQIPRIQRNCTKIDLCCFKLLNLSQVGTEQQKMTTLPVLVSNCENSGLSTGSGPPFFPLLTFSSSFQFLGPDQRWYPPLSSRIKKKSATVWSLHSRLSSLLFFPRYTLVMCHGQAGRMVTLALEAQIKLPLSIPPSLPFFLSPFSSPFPLFPRSSSSLPPFLLPFVPPFPFCSFPSPFLPFTNIFFFFEQQLCYPMLAEIKKTQSLSLRRSLFNGRDKWPCGDISTFSALGQAAQERETEEGNYARVSFPVATHPLPPFSHTHTL